MTKELTKGSPFRLIFSFMLPVLIGNIFQQLYNMADTLIVGHTVSSDAMAGVGSTGSITFLIIGFATGLTSGFAVRTSQRFGARDEAGVRKSVAVSLELCILLTAFLMSLAMPLAGPLLRLMQTPEKYFSYAYWYLFVCFGGIGATILYNISAATLRSIGDTKTPLVILVVSAVLNVGLDLLFIVVFKMKYTGAAAATVISQFVAGVGGLIYMLKAYPILRPHRSDWKSFRLWGGHIALGLPMALQFSITAIGSIIQQTALNSLDKSMPGIVTAYTAATKISNFATTPFDALGVTFATYAGQNFGARQYDRVRRGVRVCLAMAACTTLVISFTFYNLAEVLFRLFSQDDAVVAVGVGMMHVLTPVYITYVCIEVLAGALRGCGDVRVPTLITVFFVCGLRMLWLFIAVPIRHEVATVEMSYPITWSLASALFILYYVKGGWMQRCAEKWEKKQAG